MDFTKRIFYRPAYQNLIGILYFYYVLKYQLQSDKNFDNLF